MTSQTDKAKQKLAVLSSSLDDLESLLDPLFEQTLPETTGSLEPIQQAKLQTVLPYLVYDLIFIYLKSRGIDPKAHPVVPELDRVKQYFQKISTAENPPTKRAEIDKAAAQRFIKHAIAQASKPPPADEASTSAAPSAVRVPVPAKVTTKMLERQQYEQQLKAQDAQSSEEDELQVFDDDETPPQPGPPVEATSTSTKRRRPAVDPFAGYGDETSSGAATSNTNPAPSASTKPPKKKKKRTDESSPADPPSAAGTPNETSSAQGSPAPAASHSKKPKKAKKKKQK